MNTSRLLAATFVILAASNTGFSQQYSVGDIDKYQKKLNDTNDGKSASLFEHQGYKWDDSDGKWEITGKRDVSDMRDYDFHDRADSVIVGDMGVLRLYHKKDYSGGRITFLPGERESDLGLVRFHDSASSLRFRTLTKSLELLSKDDKEAQDEFSARLEDGESTGLELQDGNDGCYVILYEHPNWTRGDARTGQLVLGGPTSVSNLGKTYRFDDKADSILVGPKAVVRLYHNNNYGGGHRTFVPLEHVSDFKRIDFHDSASSIKIFHVDQLKAPY